jgi:2-keto-4-pentenoate hydratase/2-oxohepta-3-ene-1,7-dioic acid hydratase in catechol pathway
VSPAAKTVNQSAGVCPRGVTIYQRRLGWTIGNHISERTWQKQDRTLWRAKNTDTFKPMGPWIETDVKLDDLHTKIRQNGKQPIDFRTNDMAFSVVDYRVAMMT